MGSSALLPSSPRVPNLARADVWATAITLYYWPPAYHPLHLLPCQASSRVFQSLCSDYDVAHFYPKFTCKLCQFSISACGPLLDCHGEGTTLQGGSLCTLRLPSTSPCSFRVGKGPCPMSSEKFSPGPTGLYATYSSASFLKVQVLQFGYKGIMTSTLGMVGNLIYHDFACWSEIGLEALS